ncbi:MAG: hypothetical protein IMF05_13145 [Proteobacteria bacterium]|nr:hypothetical protein [Pseudomonadota bacterium]
MTWREEIDWRYLRLVTWGHLGLWIYGAVLAGLHVAGLLDGALRDGLALGAFAGLAVCLLLIFKIVRYEKNPHEKRKPRSVGISSQTFLLMIAFFVSVCAFVLLLSVIGLNSVTFTF